jgi:hypothetical protein
MSSAGSVAGRAPRAEWHAKRKRGSRPLRSGTQVLVPERAPEVEQLIRDCLAAKQAGDAGAIRANLSAYQGPHAIGNRRWEER